jgi:DNA invertase Pin-like site-specific DNA recombinase
MCTLTRLAPLYVTPHNQIRRGSEWFNAGLARAKAQGKKLGRPGVSGRIEERIRMLRTKGFGKLKIAKELGCGVSMVQRVLAA